MKPISFLALAVPFSLCATSLPALPTSAHAGKHTYAFPTSRCPFPLARMQKNEQATPLPKSGTFSPQISRSHVRHTPEGEERKRLWQFHADNATFAHRMGDRRTEIEECVAYYPLGDYDPSTALRIADLLVLEGADRQAYFYYRLAMDKVSNDNWVGGRHWSGTDLPWDDGEAIFRYANHCLRLRQWREADTAYWRVISKLKLTPIPNLEVCGITTMAERIAYIYFVLGLESTDAHFAEHVYTEAIAYFQEALRRTSAPMMKRAYASQLETLLESQQSAERYKIEAEARAVLEAQQKAAFEAQQKTSRPE